MKYIVHGVGRSGSLLITSLMAPNDEGVPWNNRMISGLINGVSFQEPNKDTIDDAVANCDNIVIHTHYLDDLIEEINLDTSEWNLIISTRRNKFDQMMSFKIAEMSNEYGVYTDKIIEPVAVDPVSFVYNYNLLKDWPNVTVTSRRNDTTAEIQWIYKLWKSTTVIEFEDLIAATDHSAFLADKLGLPNQVEYEYIHTNKSPRKYKDYVLNWEELYNLTEGKL
jgi:hypothetical protein